MEYSELLTIILTITALLLIRQLIIISRKNATGIVEDHYSGRALVPEALTRVDEDSMREFDKLLGRRFSEEQ